MADRVLVASLQRCDDSTQQLSMSVEDELGVVQFLDVPLIGDFPPLVRGNIVYAMATALSTSFAWRFS